MTYFLCDNIFFDDKLRKNDCLDKERTLIGYLAQSVRDCIGLHDSSVHGVTRDLCTLHLSIPYTTEAPIPRGLNRILSYVERGFHIQTASS